MKYNELKQNKSGAKAKVRSTKNLTPDCWLVQFNGLEACATCPEFKGVECGGGITLVSILLDHCGVALSPLEKSEIGNYFQDSENGTFYGLLQYLENPVYLPRSLSRLEQEYTKQVKKIQSRLKEPTGIRLKDHFSWQNHKDNEIIARGGYHGVNNQYGCNSCEPIKGLSQASYRDIIIKLKDGTIIYYVHQNPVAVRLEDRYILDSCNYRTQLTKGRLNRFLPYGQGGIFSEGLNWYLTNPRPKTKPKINYRKFYDGITVKRYKKYDKDYNNFLR